MAVAEAAGRPLAPARLRPRPLALAVAALVAAVAAGVVVGPAFIPPSRLLGGIADALPFVDVRSGLDAREVAILWQLRAPRVVLGVLVGAMLAMAGASYQGVFRNPLADPYLLGVAAGAGLGVTVAIVYLPPTTPDVRPAAAFIGGLAAVGATYLLGRSAARTRSTVSLILAGVAVASFLTAVQTYAQQRRATSTQEVYTFILGSLSTVGWRDVVLVLPYVAAAAVVLVLHRRLLDVMSLGDEEADASGINARRVRLVVVLAATLGTAAAVAVSGLIAFVGIIVPHTIRLVWGTSYRRILPLSVLLGGAFLVVADLVARTALAPAEVPIGVITAFFGAPFFLLVLRRAGASP
jgi:iron complex transport system permease protein